LIENNNTQQFIKQLAKREGVSEEKIKEIIIDSFRTSYCQGENANAELHFEFVDSGLSVYRLYKIVEKISDPEKETTKDNKLLKEGQMRNDCLLLPIDTKNFSYKEILNSLRKDVEEISWAWQYKLYKPQQGEIIYKSIKGKRLFQGEEYYSVDLGKGTGYWAKSESRTLREGPRLGQYFNLLIKEVREKSTGDAPQIILTRADDLFIHKLLEREIPEIKKGVIVIHDILRLPGVASKILVEKGKSAIKFNLSIDPAGTCIGKRGEAAKKISSICLEQIYFADWTEDKKKLLAKLLLPTELIKLIIKKEKEWEVVVSHQKQYEKEMIKKISDYLGIDIIVRILKEDERNEFLANKGQVLQEVSNYKNIGVRIVEEIEK